MSRKGGAALQQDVPWRAASTVKPIPKIHHSPVLRLPQNPFSSYALSIMKVGSRTNGVIRLFVVWGFVFLMFTVIYGS